MRIICRIKLQRAAYRRKVIEDILKELNINPSKS
jgi:hypothetical protein